MATKKCENCGKGYNLINNHLFKIINNKLYCSDCYPKILAELKSDEDKKLSEIIITTTNNVDGYKIIEYVGIESSEVVIGTGFLAELSADLNDLVGQRSTNFEKKLQQGKQIAFSKIKKKALNNGANAVVGIDMDYTEFTGNKIGIIINGTMVKIEKL